MSVQSDCSIGLKAEATYGTAITVDQFLEFTSESFDRSPEFVQGQGLRPGLRVRRARRRSLGKENAGGSLTVEAPTKGLGTILKAAFGTVTSTLASGETTVYQQVHTPLLDDFPDSYTIQKGVPKLAGSVSTETFLGAVCEAITVTADAGAIVTVESEWVAREVVTDEPYAAPSYPADLDLFTFVHGAITIGGSVTPPTDADLATGGTTVANVSAANVKWANGLDGAGWNLGGAGKRSRPPALGMGEITGSITAEYDSDDFRDAYLNQTPLSLVLTFEHPSTIGTASSPTLQVVVPTIYFEGELPKANSGDVISQSINIVGLDDLTPGQAPIYVVYRTTDAAV